MNKQVTVELTGPARIQAGRKQVSITMQDDATWRDVVAALARALPALEGNAITEDYDLVWPYLLNVGGRRTVRDFVRSRLALPVECRWTAYSPRF